MKLAMRVKHTRLLRELNFNQKILKIPLKDVISIEKNQWWDNRGKKDLDLMDILMAKKLKSAVKEECSQRKAYGVVKDQLYGGPTARNLPEGWKGTNTKTRINR